MSTKMDVRQLILDLMEIHPNQKEADEIRTLIKMIDSIATLEDVLFRDLTDRLNSMKIRVKDLPPSFDTGYTSRASKANN